MLQYSDRLVVCKIQWKQLYKSLYPNWTLEDFKEVYLAMEGELPE